MDPSVQELKDQLEAERVANRQLSEDNEQLRSRVQALEKKEFVIQVINESGIGKHLPDSIVMKLMDLSNEKTIREAVKDYSEMYRHLAGRIHGMGDEFIPEKEGVRGTLQEAVHQAATRSKRNLSIVRR